jgi:hypothetical protein
LDLKCDILISKFALSHSTCTSRYVAAAVHDDSVNRMVRWMKALRADLLGLGLGPFGGWQQLTGGAHGLFTLLPACDAVSIYGFTTYASCGTTKVGWAVHILHAVVMSS